MKRIILFMVALVVCFIGINFLVYKNINETYSTNENLIKKISSDVPNYTKIDDIPKGLIDAIITVEDRRFFSHYGFDVIGIGRAFIANLKAGEVIQGGSTITQQLAKNLFLSSEKKLTRKVKELYIAIKIENDYSKEEILEMYLNCIYYGPGAYGIQNASQTYFNKDVDELTLVESALLAGLPQAPSGYNPKKYPKRAKKRQGIVLDLMYKNRIIGKEVQENLTKQSFFVFQ
jgi:penicillin-binding protein 1A/penicillin-binding protein 2A